MEKKDVHTEKKEADVLKKNADFIRSQAARKELEAETDMEFFKEVEESTYKSVIHKKIEAQFMNLLAKIDMLTAKVKHKKADAMMEYIDQQKQLDKEKDEIDKKIEELEVSGVETWKTFKETVDKSLSDLKETVKNVLSKVT